MDPALHPAAPARPGLRRRAFVTAAGLAACLPATGANEGLGDLLRRGGVVVAFRHALAPGTFDPEGFRLEDCSTQRNLNEEGRDQARRIGLWFRTQGLQPSRVRSSPWCRCLETATLAFGQGESWTALASPSRSDAQERGRRVQELRRALALVPAGRFEAWVTHQFVLQDLGAGAVASAEALVLRAGTSGDIGVLARAALY